MLARTKHTSLLQFKKRKRKEKHFTLKHQSKFETLARTKHTSLLQFEERKRKKHFTLKHQSKVEILARTKHTSLLQFEDRKRNKDESCLFLFVLSSFVCYNVYQPKHMIMEALLKGKTLYGLWKTYIECSRSIFKCLRAFFDYL